MARFFFTIFLTFSLSSPGVTCAQVAEARALRTLEEIQLLVDGGKAKPTWQSLLGQYRRETGAVIVKRRFKKNRRGDRGPEKTVVLVSAETFPAFKRLFGSAFPNGLEHLHTPNQGTLLLRWEDQTYSYAKARGEWRFPTVGSIGPVILLSDSEAGRLRDYFTLNATGEQSAFHPWDIAGYGYPRDAYGNNCTAWFGHIPIGDETYDIVNASGSVDTHGDGLGGRKQRWGELQWYPPPANAQIDLRLFYKVWSAPVHARLWDLLEIPMRKANHTNPGWVALSLTALTKRERVPFVIAYVEDHTVIPSPFDPQIALVGG